MMGRAAGLHADQRRRLCGEELLHLRAAQLALHHHLPGSIHAVHLKHILGQIDSNLIACMTDGLLRWS